MTAHAAPEPQPAAPGASAVPFREALAFWWRLGWISFGGPAGQIATMHRELVERRRWISDGRFLHALSFCMALPGPEAQQLATYVGWLLHGVRGGIAAGVLFVLPSLAVLLLLSWLYLAFGHVAAVDGVLSGFRPAVVAVIAYAVVRVARRALHGVVHAALAVGALVALLLHAPFPAVILGAAALGLLAQRFGPGRAWALRPAGPAPAAGAAGAVIDDDTPAPAHARPSAAAALRTLLVGLLGWAGVLLPLVLLRGGSDVLPALAWFFTGAALITFGGAYAVLPYVAQVAIDARGWLTRPQMLDGLALGETTPGPLIMVVTFVGFVAAWREAGPGLAWAGGLVATWFTFLPSFLFIFLGAPHIERLRGRHAVTAPLAAVSAAVVGVMAHLGVDLAGPVLLPAGRLDPFAGGVALGSAALLFLRGWSVHAVVLAAGAAGLLHGLLR